MTIAKDGIGELCSVDGLGNIILGGALGGAEQFSSVYIDGDLGIPVKLELLDSNYAVIAWERVRCTYVETGNQLVRGAVMGSSNAGAPVSFGSGTKRAFVFLPTEDLDALDSAILSTAQTLTEPQKAQARTNIGAGTGDASMSAVNSAIIVAINSAKLGIDAKPSCRVAATGNVNLLAPPSSIDGVTLANVDRVFLPLQTNAAQNGAYEFQFDPFEPQLVRTDDGFTHRASVEISSGATYAGRRFLLTTLDPIVLGTTPLTWELVPTAGSMAIGGAITGASVNRVLFAGASSGLAQSSNLTFDGNVLGVGFSGVQFGSANNKIQGGVNELIMYAPSTVLRMANNSVAKFGVWNGVCGVGACSGGVGNANRVGTAFRVTPGESTGNGAAKGLQFYHGTTGAAGADENPVTLGGELTGGGVWDLPKLKVGTFVSTSYTVATLPAGVVTTRAWVSDETTGAFRGTCVGGGSIETPVHYANGAWKNG